MNSYPLFRTTLSNERLMSALLLVLLLYNLPGFLSAPAGLLRILLLVALGLALDAAAHFLIYKRPVCAVSAAVTTLVLYTLSPGASVGIQFLALAAALVVGKFIWGGTGKNALNPAMIGLVVLSFLAPISYPPFPPALTLLPAILLSLPFLFIRPYAGLGMMLGMVLALVLRHDLTFQALAVWGVPFWGCIVITDPVTTTSRPAAGLLIGAAAGFVPMLTGSTPAALPLGILLSNILSWQADRLKLGNTEALKKVFGKTRRIKFSPVETPFADLSERSRPETPKPVQDLSVLDCGTILERIEKHAVTGCGGAAFPAVRKLRAAMEATLSSKYLIINAAECDPGLIHDKWLLINRREEIQQGIELLCRCIAFKSVTVAAKDFFGAEFKPPVQLHKVQNYYPAGAEKILIRDVLKIALKPDEVPSECGILVFNLQTVAVLNDAVRRDRKSDVRYITVADLEELTGTVAKVRLGSGVYETVRQVFPNAITVYAGGGAMNARLTNDGAIIDEKTNFLAIGAVKGFREALCSQCGFCSAYCPASLPVREISRLIDAGETDKAATLRPEACIECNLCSAVCPAGRDQAKRLRLARAAAKKHPIPEEY